MAKACFHFMRVVLVIISLLFLLLGLAIVALALFVKLASPLDEVMRNENVSGIVNIALYILIGLGAFMAIFGFVGCIGACRKSTICLSIYITILLIIILAEIGLGVFIVIQTKIMTTQVDNYIDKSVTEYNDNRKTSSMNLIQSFLQCCGSDGPSSYNKRPPPASCCQNPTKAEDGTCPSTEDRWETGCKAAYKNIFQRRGFPILIGVVLGIAVIEFIGIAFAIAICCHSRRHDAGYVSVVT